MHPLVTVVVPACNAASWIEETLDSVAAQRWPHDRLEVVVVDDGSEDGTAEAAGRHLRRTDLRHEILTRGATGGPAAARNQGWRRASGEWLQFLDADDLIEPDKLTRQLAEPNVAGDVAVLVSAWQSLAQRAGGWHAAGEAVDPRVGEDTLVSLLRADNFIATGSQLMRRAWVEVVGGYDETMRVVEDVNLLLRLAMAGGRVQRVASPKPLFSYRRRPHSHSTRDARGFVEARLANARLVEDYWRQAGELTPPRRQCLADVYSEAVRGWTVDDPPAFDRIASHIESLDPAFVPTAPEALRQLARVVGYRRAERVAGRYRRLKALVRPAS